MCFKSSSILCFARVSCENVRMCVNRIISIRHLVLCDTTRSEHLHTSRRCFTTETLALPSCPSFCVCLCGTYHGGVIVHCFMYSHCPLGFVRSVRFLTSLNIRVWVYVCCHILMASVQCPSAHLCSVCRRLVGFLCVPSLLFVLVLGSSSYRADAIYEYEWEVPSTLNIKGVTDIHTTVYISLCLSIWLSKTDSRYQIHSVPFLYFNVTNVII